MKYVVVIESDNELSEDAIKNLEEVLFLGDKNAMCYFDITSIKEVPKKIGNYVIGNFQKGYNSALIDCGVIEDDNCPLIEIVTCKDCKNCWCIEGSKNKLCEKHGCMKVSNNFYCADGERKE